MARGDPVTARNKAAFAAGQRKRAAIRQMLAAHSPLLRPLTLEQLQARLRDEFGLYAAVSTVAYHREQIRLEQASEDCNCSNLSNSGDAA